MLRYVFFQLLFTGLYLSGFGQHTDGPEGKGDDGVTPLEPVVVTAQHNPKSVDKSVFEVRVIDRGEIERQAANNLADLLNQILNINIIPNASTGKSGVQLFGLDAQYFKILVDNIPLINEEGLGNNTDLTQINLDDIARIEIVEGAMGVQYGANAVSGVINIITKKSSEHKWQITPYMQEETVGGEYGLDDQGRHIQSLAVGHNFSDRFYGSVAYTRNDFKGHFNHRKGRHHTENDGLRGYEWLPKEQQTAKALLNYTVEDFRMFYKFEFFDENIERYSASVRTNYNPATQTSNPTASDETFISRRFYNHLNASGAIQNRIQYDVSLSLQQQKRDIETYTYHIERQQRENVERQEYESRKGYYSRGNFSNFLAGDKLDFQAGYEFSIMDGYVAPLAGFFDDPVSRTLPSYDAFASAEIHPGERWSLRPGARLLWSPRFSPMSALSLSGKYLFSNGLEVRTVIGTSPRTPSFEELYTYFVDINHDVRGNENLTPEQGYSAFLHLKKAYWLNNDRARFSTKLSGWYLSVDDRIELTIVNPMPLAYQFNNIDRFRSWGVSTTQQLQHGNLRAGLGASLTGVSKVLDSREEYNDDFLYSLQLNADVSYRIPKWNTVVSTWFKYNGPQYLFVQKQGEENETILVRGKQDGFSWWDASVRKSFYDNRFELTIGARNLLDITRVDTTATEGGAHSAAPASLMLGYGRSYFVKMQYNLNI